jgi:hypothetical protein
MQRKAHARFWKNANPFLKGGLPENRRAADFGKKESPIQEGSYYAS